MAAFVDFDIFIEDLHSAVHDFNAAGDTIKGYLTNTAPNVATHAVKADLAGITEQNGYTEFDTQNDLSQSSGTATISGVDHTVEATGAVGPFRYLVLFNSTTAAKTNPLISYYDYGSSISLSNGEDFVVDVLTNIYTGAFS